MQARTEVLGTQRGEEQIRWDGKWSSQCQPECALSCVRLYVASWTVAPTRLHRLLCPWDSPGKHNGMGCHFLLRGDLPNPGIKPTSLESPALAGRFFTI